MAVVISTECSDEKGRQRQAARRSHKIRSCMNARRRASMDMAMDLKKHGRNLLPGLRAALARPSASSSHRRTCRPRRPNRLRLPEPCCCGDCQHPCPSPSRLSGLLGMRGALAGDAAAAAANYQNGLPMAALHPAGLNASAVGPITGHFRTPEIGPTARMWRQWAIPHRLPGLWGAERARIPPNLQRGYQASCALGSRCSRL